MKRYLCLQAILMLMFAPAYSQTEIEGYVYDAKSGESLPSATVLLDGTYRGTVTNSEGRFSIMIDEYPATLVVRYIGYETEKVNIQKNKHGPIEVAMELSVTELDEIVVTEEDPGLSIMERVIARKQIWRENLKTYQAEAYTRQILSNDTSIVSISESSSLVFWDVEEGHREIQVSKKQTSNISEDQNFAGVNYQPNFYDDNVEIAGYNLVGITHLDAPKFYHFELQDIQQMDGKPVYEISISPRREKQPTFIGTAWVLGRDYALIEIDLKPNEVVNFPPPVQEFNLTYKQQFSNFGGEFWFPVDMRVDGTVRVGMVGLRFPPFIFHLTSRISDYEVNVSLPDSIYQKKEVFVQADSTFIQEREGEVEAIPLTTEESAAYESIDSTRTFEEAFKPEGFLANMIDTDEDENNQDSGFLSNLTSWLPGGLGFRGRFNRVDGYHLGLKYKKGIDSIGLEFSGFSGYSFHSEIWDIGGSLNQRLFTVGNSNFEIGVGYEKSTDMRFNSNLYSLTMNSIQTMLGTEDYFDYFKNEKITTGITVENIFQDTDINLSANRELHSSFDENSVFDHSLFGWHKKRRMNPQIEEGTLHSISAELAYNRSSSDFGFAGKNQVILSAEHSSDNIGSSFDFTQFTTQVDLRINTFYRRRLFANTLDISISGGTSVGDLPPQRLGAVDVALSRFTPFGALKTRQSVPYVGSEYWSAYGEHNFRTIPFELLGFDYLVDKAWGIILFGGAAYADAKDKEPFNLFMTDGIHSEIGASLNNIFGVVRVDFAKRLDRPGYFFGISVPRYF